ncbi:MAG: hypothetical protein KBS65_06600 [Prevotella sp.]|nr:hypothetical protein [Candidatus Equicola stercoris]
MKEKMSAYHQPLMLNPNKFPCETSLQINLFNFIITLMGFLLFHAKNSKKGSLSPTLASLDSFVARREHLKFSASTREGAKSLPLWGTKIYYLCLRRLDFRQQRSAFRLRGGSSMFLAKSCFLLGFIVRWWHTTVECLWMGVKACLQTNRHKHNTRHLQDGNNKYKLFFLFLSKKISAKNKKSR